MKRNAEAEILQAESHKRGKLRPASVQMDSVADFVNTISKQKAVKAMRAHESRLEDLRVIQKRQSVAEIVPFLEIFPKEVWAMILSKLEDPMDLWNTWNVHPMFRNLSEKTRTAEVLFPHVVGLLFSYHNHLNGHRTTCNCSECKEIPKLDYNCKLRKVSKSLRDAVDKSYEDRLMSHLHDNQEYKLHPIPTLLIHLPIHRHFISPFLSSFCEGPDETRGKRCFHRSFEILITRHHVVQMSEEFFHRYSQVLIQLLESIGDQIWHFKIKFEIIDWLEDRQKFQNGEFWSFQLYELICQCCSLMTNLKWIDLDIYDLHFLRHTITLKSFFRSHPFPCLQQLEKISFAPCKIDVFLGFEILASVLQQNSHVKMLSVKTCHDGDKMFNFYRRLFEFMQTIPCELEAINFEKCEHNGRYDVRHFTTSLGHLQPLIHLNWPLKVLQLSGIDASATRSLASLFYFLNNFPSLKELSLSLVALSVGDDCPFLKLPQLTHFQITIHKDNVDYSKVFNVQFFYSLQFLLHSRKLKHLIYSNRNRVSSWKIRRFMQNHECHEKLLNFRGGRRDLTHSNIWDAFPELEYVRTENECEEKMITDKRVWDLKRVKCVKYTREYRNGAPTSFAKTNHYLIYKLKTDGSGWRKGSFNPSWRDEE